MTVLLHFFLMMMMHPEVAQRAQKEIEAVVGSDRLPTFADRPSLPYVDAIMSEVLRWGAPVPLGMSCTVNPHPSNKDLRQSDIGLPHRLMEDDVYDGMHIPRGTLVFPNVW